MIILYVVLIVLVLIVLWAVGAYNHFVRMVQRAKEAWRHRCPAQAPLRSYP